MYRDYEGVQSATVVRIENDIVVTESGHTDLMHDIPVKLNARKSQCVVRRNYGFAGEFSCSIYFFEIIFS